MKTNRLPNIHPGEILLQDFLEPKGITRHRLAKATGIPQAQVLRICTGTRGICGPGLTGFRRSNCNTFQWAADRKPE